MFDGLSPAPRPQSPAPRAAFTLVEMLVVVTVIGIMAAMTLGALQLARESSREQATKATIAKLNNIILRQYDSYKTRRVPIRIPNNTPPRNAAELKLKALREIMRLEMPERWTDIIDPDDGNDNPDLNATIAITSGSYTVQIPRPALSQLYAQRYISSTPDSNGPPGYGPAECLYMLVSLGIPDAMEQFHQSEIGDVDGDGYPEFIDGWGRPIMWLRFAPGFSHPYSDIQFADPVNHHDPFDTRRVDAAAYHLIPLIYSAGANGRYGIELAEYYHYLLQQNPYANLAIGAPTATDGHISDHQEDNIHNHHIEQR